MNSATWLLFESLPALAAVVVVAWFILLVYWRRTGRPRPLLIGLGAGVLLLAVQALVVTRREHAARVLSAIEADIVRSRTDALADALAADFETEGIGREDFLAFVERRLEAVDISWIERLRLRVVESEPDRFRAAAFYLSEMSVEQYAATTQTRWTFTFVHTLEGWKIVHLQCDEVDGAPWEGRLLRDFAGRP